MREDSYSISVIGIVAGLYAVFAFMGLAKADMNCPPGTIFSVRLQRCVSDSLGRRRMQERPPRPTGNELNDRDERSAANLVNIAMRGLDCGRAADALRQLANQVLALQAAGTPLPGRARPIGRLGSRQPPVQNPGEETRRRWREHVHSPRFWKKVWDRMADAYRSCNRECFDDGVSVGVISATAYCSASVALEGLPGPGYIEQPSLPVCETSVFAGCVKAYGETAASSPGCATYTQNQFESIFAEYESQDCHL